MAVCIYKGEGALLFLGVNTDLRGGLLSTHTFYDDNLASDRSRSELDGEIFNTGSQLDFFEFDCETDIYNDQFFLYGLCIKLYDLHGVRTLILYRSMIAGL